MLQILSAFFFCFVLRLFQIFIFSTDFNLHCCANRSRCGFCFVSQSGCFTSTSHPFWCQWKRGALWNCGKTVILHSSKTGKTGKMGQTIWQPGWQAKWELKQFELFSIFFFFFLPFGCCASRGQCNFLWSLILNYITRFGAAEYGQCLCVYGSLMLIFWKIVAIFWLIKNRNLLCIPEADPRHMEYKSNWVIRHIFRS